MFTKIELEIIEFALGHYLESRSSWLCKDKDKAKDLLKRFSELLEERNEVEHHIDHAHQDD